MSSSKKVLSIICLCAAAFAITYFFFLAIRAGNFSFNSPFLMVLPACLVLLIGIWMSYSWIVSRITKISFSRALYLDAFSYLSMLLLGIAYMPLPFPAHISAIEQLKLPLGIAYISLVYVKLLTLLFLLLKKTKFLEMPVRVIAKYLFFIILLFYIFIGIWNSYAIHATGDEPVYLLMTQSWIKDRDFDIANNMKQREDWFSFFPEEEFLKGESIRPDGKIYIGRRFAWPILMVPGYSLAKWRGAVLTINIISAVFILNMFWFLYEIFSDKKRAFYFSLLAGMSFPMIYYCLRTMYHVPAALAILFVYRKISNIKEDNIYAILLIGAVLSVLPWFHTQYMAIDSVLLLFFLYTRWSDLRRALFVFVPIIVSALIGGIVNRYLTGGIFIIEDKYLGFYDRGIWNGIVGVFSRFFDQEVGLFFTSPVYLLFLLGFFVFARKFFKTHFFFFLVPAVCVWTLTLLPRFASGFALDRSLIQIIPFLMVMVCYVWKEAGGRLFHQIKFALAGLSLGIAFFLTAVPWLMKIEEDGMNVFTRGLFKLLQWDISFLFPTLIVGIKVDYYTISVYSAFILLLNIYFIRCQMKKEVLRDKNL